MGWRNRIVENGEETPDKLIENPNNWRIHPKNQQAALAAVLDEIGWVQDVIVNRTTGHLMDGHLRVQLALQRGETVIPVKYVELSEEEERLILATLDPIGAMATQDTKIYLELLEGIETGSAALQELLTDMGGISFDEQDQLEDPGAQIDRAEELREKWGVESGQLWQLGEHRLICGDCTDASVIKRVMDGEKADMVFTDPPYNVSSESSNYAADRSKAMRNLKASEWDQNYDIQTLFPVLDSILDMNCAVYICTSHWLAGQVWKWMMKWSDFYSYCVWCKPNPMPSLSKRHWTWATELIPYAVRGKHTSNFPIEGHALNWWDIPKNKETDHPTEKALGIPLMAIRFSSGLGDIVFDGFLGSGTTLVACEHLSRKCKAIEISPAYCAVAIERWVQMTGQEPRIIS